MRQQDIRKEFPRLLSLGCGGDLPGPIPNQRVGSMLGKDFRQLPRTFCDAWRLINAITQFFTLP